ncbi:MAG: hypothetical protein IT536_06935 [Hyphomicrobiales bacterium]|nr:hypothetical protein [Hyphomicrobiales bacterium]
MRVSCALGAALALTCGGCSYQLDSMISRQRDAERQTTGSVLSMVPRASNTGLPLERDLAAARAAMSEALGKGASTASVPWEDPAIGARGTVTPLSNAYTQDGATCRDFLASFVRNGSEAWLEGEACRGSHGRWEVRQMRPWRRS